MPILGIIASANNTVSFKFIAGDNNANLYSSTDGITWQLLDMNLLYTSTSNVTPTRIWECNSNIITSYTTSSQAANSLSTDGTTWNRFASALNTISDVIYDGTKYFGIDGDGAVGDSTDLKNWTFRSFPASGDYNNSPLRILYGNSTYVIIMSRNQILSSTDGITWTSRLGSSVNDQWNDAIYANNLFVAVGETDVDTALYKGYIRTSTNGITWTTRTPSTSTTNAREIRSVAWNGTYFIAATDAIGAQYSTDGITWSTGSFPSAVNSNWYGVGAKTDGTVFLGGDLNEIFTSTNGTTWTSRTNALLNYAKGNAVFSGTKWYVILRDTTSTNAIVTSTDFVTWTGIARNNLTYQEAEPRSIKNLNNTYLITGDGSTVVTSTNAISWTKQTLATVDNTTIRSSAYGASTYAIVGDAGRLETSTDTVTWTSRTSGFGTTNINDVTFGENVFVAVGNAGVLRTSTDGISWTARTSRFGTSNIQNVLYESSLTDKFVAVGNGGTISSSTNGIAWTTRTSGVTVTLSDITFGAGVWVAVSSTATSLISSTDAITWTTRTNPTSPQVGLQSVKYSPSKGFVAMGDGRASTGTNGQFSYITSTDGITWTSRTTSNIKSAATIFSVYAE